MPRSRLLVPRVPQPKPGVGATIDWSHPLASRLCFALLLNERRATQCQSLVGLTRGAFAGSSGPSWTGGERSGLTFPGGANTVGYLTFGAETFATDLFRNTSNPATIAMRIYATSQTNDTLAGRNDGNTISAGWQIDHFSGASLIFAKESSATNMQVGTVLPLNRWTTFVIVGDGSLTATNLRLYADGVLLTHTADANGSGTPGSDAAQTLYVGRGNANYGSGNTSSNSTFEFFYAWKRMLSPAEVLRLTREPYALFRDPADLFVGYTAAAAVTAAERSDPFIVYPV